MLCNDLQQEGAKPSLDLASEFFCCVPLHNIWYGIREMIPLTEQEERGDSLDKRIWLVHVHLALDFWRICGRQLLCHRSSECL